MKIKFISGLVLLCMPLSLLADNSFYCPQNHAYINVGMSANEVIAACGQPLSQQDSNQPIVQRIPVQQLIYNNQGTGNAFFGVWNVPTGSGGTQLQVDVVNNRIKAIKVNGSDSNAFSICNGASIEIGDQVGKVYGSCGSPSVVNSTFINQIVPTATKPQIWIYQPGQYQPTVSLTFVDGKLQSINK
ncbi:hypothetical protein TUM19329_26850 [Legionella antarctica]|uniref:DUF2845 domain-containing protein n=1 Tax=Legionella antarctica TaxID=2708020 RepID=A0A6F8T6L2_9GAMM|nr:DUF2845 domain-containing protein [Legionella antarctica]BCA96324.1 hypothetical protein TUM19329_26850 [Legionella antarctica]